MMQARVYLIALDPSEVGDSVKFAETEFRPAVERMRGGLGISLWANPELGVVVLESFWASREVMLLADQRLSPSYHEGLRRTSGTISAERYGVPVFEQGMPLSERAALCLTRMDIEPVKTVDAVEVYGDTMVPWLADRVGFCRTLLLADTGSGRMIGEAAWRDRETLAANRSTAATARVNFTESTGCVIRAVEEYGLVLNTASKPSP